MGKFVTLDTALNLSEIICHMGDCVVVADKDMKLLAMTQTFSDLYGMTPAEMLGKNVYEVYPDFKNSVFFACIEHSFRTQKPHSIVGYSSRLLGHFIVKTLPYLNNYLLHIQPLNTMVSKSGYASVHDDLTGLSNRMAFDEDMSQLTQHGTCFGLIFVDVNKFRSFNETLGFEQGDRLLMELAARLKTNLTHNIYRVGPNQFAVAAITTREAALEVCTGLLATFAKPFKLHGKDYHVTASAGFKYIDNDEVTPSEHVSNVESALREAKRLKNGYVEYKIGSDVANGLAIVTELKLALQEHQLEAFYQGQVDTITGKICGAEALVRWRHPERGLVAPMAFLPVVQEYGLNIELDRYMVTRVLNDMTDWIHARALPLNISINLSASSICSLQTVEFVRSELRRTGVAAANITIEITENAVMENVEISRSVIQGLSDMGIKIAIDDFGTGYSSMGYLLKYPTDILKIDKEFINGVSASSTLQHVASSMIRLGKSLNMLVVAEGVETKEDAQFLESQGCDILQGFYFSKPVSKDEFDGQMEKLGVSNAKSMLF